MAVQVKIDQANRSLLELLPTLLVIPCSTDALLGRCGYFGVAAVGFFIVAIFAR